MNGESRDYGEFKDYVLTKFKSSGKVYLFRAPAFCFLKAGDEVDVGGMERPKVLCKVTLKDDSEELAALMAACDATDVRRIRGVLEYKAFNYPGEEEEEF